MSDQDRAAARPEGSFRLGLHHYGLAIVAAVAFACTDILSKLALQSGANVLTAATVRGVIGIALLWGWLRLSRRSAPSYAAIDSASRRLSSALGVVFALNLYLLFVAIETVEVPIAIATYFVYPLLTGIGAAVLGLERWTVRGLLAAAVALIGLSLMIGAHPGGLALVGVAAALLSACCRVAMLLVSRAHLGKVDPALITWHSLISSTILLALAMAATNGWQPPASTAGWAAMLALSVSTTIGILAVYASTARIGPFQTALLMNLEPLLTTIGSALFLGEILTATQLAGCAIMLAALVAFQWRA